jgi:hypothetical protein
MSHETPIHIPGDDVLGRVARGLGAGLAFGVALQAVVGLMVRTLVLRQAPVEVPDLGSPAAAVLLVGSTSAAAAAAMLTWHLLRPIGNAWRQGMFALLAAFGSFALSLAAMPVDRYLGRAGLALFAVLAGWASWRLARSPDGTGAAA